MRYSLRLHVENIYFFQVVRLCNRFLKYFLLFFFIVRQIRPVFVAVQFVLFRLILVVIFQGSS